MLPRLVSPLASKSVSNVVQKLKIFSCSQQYFFHRESANGGIILGGMVMVPYVFSPGSFTLCLATIGALNVIDCIQVEFQRETAKRFIDSDLIERIDSLNAVQPSYSLVGEIIRDLRSLNLMWESELKELQDMYNTEILSKERRDSP